MGVEARKNCSALLAGCIGAGAGVDKRELRTPGGNGHLVYRWAILNVGDRDAQA